jgi:hypothetical protein
MMVPPHHAFVESTKIDGYRFAQPILRGLSGAGQFSVASPTVEQTHQEYDAEELASVNASEDQWMDELEQAANAQWSSLMGK